MYKHLSKRDSVPGDWVWSSLEVTFRHEQIQGWSECISQKHSHLLGCRKLMEGASQDGEKMFLPPYKIYSQKIGLFLLLHLLNLEEVPSSVIFEEVICLSSYSLSGFGLLIYLCKPYMPFYTSESEWTIKIHQSKVTFFLSCSPVQLGEWGMVLVCREKVWKNPLDRDKKWTILLIKLSEINKMAFHWFTQNLITLNESNPPVRWSSPFPNCSYYWACITKFFNHM